MDAGRLRPGETIAGVSGVALLIIMFLPWFGFDLGSAAQDIANSLGVSVNVDVPNANFNAWESFDFIDLILLLTVIAAVSTAIMSRVGDRRRPPDRRERARRRPRDPLDRVGSLPDHRPGSATPAASTGSTSG